MDAGAERDAREDIRPDLGDDERKPMNNGTAEQEQNGVTMPSKAASTLPTPCRRPDSKARVRSGAKKVCTTPMANTMPHSKSSTLGVS